MEAYLPLLTWQFPSTSCCVHGSRTALFLLGGEYRCSSSNLKLSPFFLNSCCHSLQWAEEKVERIWSPGSIAQPYCSLSNHFPVSEIIFSALHTHFSVLLLFFSPHTFSQASITVLPNMVAASYMQLFKFKIQFPSYATHSLGAQQPPAGQWLVYQTIQLTGLCHHRKFYLTVLPTSVLQDHPCIYLITILNTYYGLTIF